MAPLFMGLRAGVAGREADLDFCARSVRDLWHTGPRWPTLLSA
ncbi:hypothetical protein [Streptomyces sp. ISL-86]|nr:hypothetical protein [Streptomyces sp. ISL-86]